LNLIRCSFS